MSALTKDKFENWLNPSMLTWARNWRGMSIEDVASKFKKTPEQIEAWETSQATPTVKQTRKLAKIYQRSFMEFFLKQPPKLPRTKSIPDFRLHKDILNATRNREIELIIEWAIAHRSSALDLFSELGEKPIQIPKSLFCSLKTSSEEAAEAARKIVDFKETEQFNLKKAEAYKLPTLIRNKLETIGILTLKESKLQSYGIRGFCIAEFPLPVIVIGNEAPTAQAFTIAHEFAHISLKAGGLSGPRNREYNQVPEEHWCDRFAAAFLMPKNILTKIYSAVPKKPMKEIGDEDLEKLASMFKVSPHAMLIRLVHLKYVNADYYWNNKKAQLDDQDSNYKSFGRPKYYGTRFQSKNGELYTNLVIEAWSSGRITNHNAAQYMGIDKLRHLYDIRENLGS